MPGLISDYFNSTITIVAYNKSVDQISNKVLYENIPAYIQDKNKLLLNEKGEEVIGNSQIIVDYNKVAVIKYSYRVKISVKFGVDYQDKNKEYPIKMIEHAGGFDNMSGYIGIWI